MNVLTHINTDLLNAELDRRKHLLADGICPACHSLGLNPVCGEVVMHAAASSACLTLYGPDNRPSLKRDDELNRNMLCMFRSDEEPPRWRVALRDGNGLKYWAQHETLDGAIASFKVTHGSHFGLAHPQDKLPPETSVPLPLTPSDWEFPLKRKEREIPALLPLHLLLSFVACRDPDAYAKEPPVERITASRRDACNANAKSAAAYGLPLDVYLPPVEAWKPFDPHTTPPPVWDYAAFRISAQFQRQLNAIIRRTHTDDVCAVGASLLPSLEWRMAQWDEWTPADRVLWNFQWDVGFCGMMKGYRTQVLSRREKCWEWIDAMTSPVTPLLERPYRMVRNDFIGTPQNSQIHAPRLPVPPENREAGIITISDVDVREIAALLPKSMTIERSRDFKPIDVTAWNAEARRMAALGLPIEGWINAMWKPLKVRRGRYVEGDARFFRVSPEYIERMRNALDGRLIPSPAAGRLGESSRFWARIPNHERIILNMPAWAASQREEDVQVLSSDGVWEEWKPHNGFHYLDYYYRPAPETKPEDDA